MSNDVTRAEARASQVEEWVLREHEAAAEIVLAAEAYLEARDELTAREGGGMNHTDLDAQEALGARRGRVHTLDEIRAIQDAARRAAADRLDEDHMPIRGRGPVAPGCRPPLVHLVATASVLAVTVACVLLFLGAWIDSAPLVIAGGVTFLAALITIAVLTFACDRERP